MFIDVGRPRHHSSESVEARVRAYEAEKDAAIKDLSNEWSPITDDVAVTIASWYMTPRGYGADFCTLAQNGRVETDDLIRGCLNEVEFIKASPNHYDHPEIAISELHALMYWAAKKAGDI